MAVTPVQLISDGNVRVLKFAHVASEYDNDGWHTNQFYSAMGEDFDYDDLYSELNEIRFLAHLNHAMLHNPDINYAGLFKTFGQFRLDNIRKVLRNGAVTLFNPVCPALPCE